MNGEWTVPQSLITPQGTLALFDGSTLDGYVPVPDECQVGPAVRATVEHVPQGDGDLIRSRWKTGIVYRPTFQLYSGGAISVGAARRAQFEALVLHLEAIRNSDGRKQWTPSGAANRFLDGLRLLEWPNPSVVDNPLKKVTFALDTRFPYAIAAAQVSTTGSGTFNVTNGGNVPFYPVIRINGPFTAFTLTNNSVVDDDGVALKIVYDSTLPGAAAVAAGHYIELVTFGGGTAYLDGNSSNLDPGVSILQSEFFPLAPGVNSITIAITGTATTATFLVNDAWGLV